MKIIVVALFAMLLTNLAFGQKESIPINVSFFNSSTAIPFTRLLTRPVHPGIQLGTEFNYKTGKKSRIFQTANIQYFYHRYLAQGIGLSSEIGYEYRTRSGLSFSSLLGVGYMHTFSTSQEYSFSNGKYEKKPDRGNLRFTPSFALDLGFYLKPESKTSSKVFIRYQGWAEYPYSPGFIPIMAHINIHLGFKFFISK